MVYRDSHPIGEPIPTVSVVIITRDRPDHLVVSLAAVLRSTFRDFELVVVDQSAQPSAADIVEHRAATDSRVRLVRDSGKGAARARNIGASATTGDIVVFTDDDCEPEPAWLGTIVRSLHDEPTAGIAFGAVIPAVHNPKDGFIIGFRPSRRARMEGRLAKVRDAGISANVALRRTALQVIGGFDEMLGPGAYFSCAEDFDLTYRVLAHGYALLHLPEARVVHHGLRDWRSGSDLVRQTYIAIGAAYMKHVRLLDVVGLVLLLQEIGLAFGNIAKHLAQRQGPFGFGRLWGLVLGIRRSFELKVDPLHATYNRPAEA